MSAHDDTKQNWKDEWLYVREGYPFWPFHVFQCLSLELSPSCLGTSKHGRAEKASLLLYRIKRTSCSGNLFERLGDFLQRTGGLK